NTAHFVHGTTVTPLLLPDPIPAVREILSDFVTALRSGAPMPIPLEEGLRAVAIADAFATRARDAIASGAKFLLVDALPASRPILERLGFEHLTDTWPCEWKPPESPDKPGV